jgi:flavodoxin
MKAVVVYESMYGNTHLVADAIAAGIRDVGGSEVVVAPVDTADDVLLDGADLLVVGGPTHVHGMSRESTRKAAVEAAHKDGSDLTVEPDAEGDGLREWFDELGELGTAAAAFDTRLDAPPALTGRASKGIGRRLRKHGCELVVDPESFVVTKHNHLLADEGEHAREWGHALARAFAAR